MKPSKNCPFCKGKLVRKEVEKFLRSNGDTAIMHVNAEVCVNCGMKVYDPRVIARIAEVKRKLRSGQTDEFTVIGKSYEVA